MVGEEEEDEEEVGEEEKAVDQSSTQLAPTFHVNWVCSLPRAGLACSHPAMVKRDSVQLPLLLGQVGIPSTAFSEAALHGHAQDDKGETRVYKYFINS